MGRRMITRPTWKCPCIKLFITYFRHLETGQYGGLGMITRPIWKCPCINLYIINDQRVFVYCNCSYSTKLIQYCLTWVKIGVNKHNNTLFNEKQNYYCRNSSKSDRKNIERQKSTFVKQLYMNF
jgi:hypothetical protein